jgi:anti-sigma-K factor RskA
MDRQDEHVDNLIDAYSLGALEPDEVERVERHLETCDACRALLEAVRAVTNELLLAVPPVSPPPALRGRILSRIHEEAQPARPDGDQTPAPQTETAAHTGRLGRLLRSLFGGDTPAIADSAADTLLRDLLLDPEVVIRPIAATEAARDAGASFVSTPARHEGIVLAQGLHPLDAQHAYQVWLLRDGQPQPNNLFMVDRAGRGISIVRTSEAPLEFDALAITLEPSSGSPGPTGEIVLAGALKDE